MQSMPLGDASGSVEVATVAHVDVVGTDVAELILVLAVAEHPDERIDLVVCDSGGAWCTKPTTIDRIREARAHSFQRHPRGVLVTTTDAARLFPVEGTP